MSAHNIIEIEKMIEKQDSNGLREKIEAAFAEDDFKTIQYIIRRQSGILYEKE